MSTAKGLSSTVDRRYDFVFLFDVKDGNPNGDPDAGNLPRIDPQTLQGFTTDGCIKRKIRNAVEIIKSTDAAKPENDEPLGLPTGEKALSHLKQATFAKPTGNNSGLRYEIYFKNEGILNDTNRRGFTALGIDPVEGKAEGEEESEGEDEAGDNEHEKSAPSKRRQKKGVKAPETAPDRRDVARLWMCRNFFDVRTFGAVMSTGVNAGQVRGPAQLTYARSIDRILPIEAAITRKSVNTDVDAQKQIKKHGFITGTFGRKSTVSYGLYRGNGFVNPCLAMGPKGTGFTFGDLRLFFDAMLRMFDFDASSSHGLMALRQIHVFEHSSALGNDRAFSLIERVSVAPLNNGDGAITPRSFADYENRIAVNLDGLKEKGITYYLLPRDSEQLFPTDEP